MEPHNVLSSFKADLGPLADPRYFGEPIKVDDSQAEGLITQLKKMVLIRRLEELIGELVAGGEVKCPCHLAIGQEAIPVAIASCLTKQDRIFGNHRSHALFLALGGDPFALLAEVLGRAKGCSRGMGGSMHLADPENGLLGTVPIVAATMPLAVGAAWAAKMDAGRDIAVSFFGDGASEEGVFHECLNFAAVYRLPILFVCENNLFSSHLHVKLRQPHNSIARYAAAHSIPSEVVDGNDVTAVSRAALRMIHQAREGCGPYFLEAVTYRWRGHVGPKEDLDVGLDRKIDLGLWKRRDPIGRLAEALKKKAFITEEDFNAMQRETEEALFEALERARCAPYPDAGQLLRSVYTDKDGNKDVSRW